MVMTTLQSESATRSLNDSALNPAKTAEWTAPILAQARKAAVACHVMGRLWRQHLSLCVSLSSAVARPHVLDRDRIPLLDTPRFQDIRNLARLLHQFLE